LRIRGRKEEGGPVDILGRELAARQEDKHELAALERRENIFAHEQGIAVADPFVGQDLQEVVVVDRAILIEDVFPGHLAALIEDVDLLELRPGDFLQRSGHQDSREGRAEASEYETGKQRSEEHTSELQSRSDLVCRLLLEKKKTERTPSSSNSSRRSATHRPASPCDC